MDTRAFCFLDFFRERIASIRSSSRSRLTKTLSAWFFCLPSGIRGAAPDLRDRSPVLDRNLRQEKYLKHLKEVLNLTSLAWAQTCNVEGVLLSWLRRSSSGDWRSLGFWRTDDKK